MEQPDHPSHIRKDNHKRQQNHDSEETSKVSTQKPDPQSISLYQDKTLKLAQIHCTGEQQPLESTLTGSHGQQLLGNSFSHGQQFLGTSFFCHLSTLNCLTSNHFKNEINNLSAKFGQSQGEADSIRDTRYACKVKRAPVYKQNQARYGKQ